MARLAALVVAALLVPAGAGAAAPASKAKAPAARKAAEPAKAPDDPELAGAGKVIEIDTSGNAKTVKGTATDPELKPGVQEVGGEALPPAPAKPEPQPEAAGPKLKSGELSQREACRLRVKAQCGFVVRCLSTSDAPAPLSCEEMEGVCEGMPLEKARYSRKDAEACAQAVASVSCPASFDNPAALDPEAGVPACKPVRAADAKGRAPAGGAGKSGFDPADFDIGALTGE